MPEPKYLINLPDPMDIFPSGQSVVEREHLAHALYMSDKFEARFIDPAEHYRPLNAKTDILRVGDTILFVRPGGFGDILFLTPAIRQLKAFYPGVKFVVACHPQYEGVLRNNPHVDRVIQYPVPWEEFQTAAKHVWLEGFIEQGGEDAEHIDAISLVKRKCGLPESDDNNMEYFVADMERAWATEKYPKDDDRPRVGIQAQASAKCRTYPFVQLEKVMNRIHEAGCQVVIFGNPDSVDADPEFLNLTADKLTFRESAAVAETCDVIVAPDSAMCHIGSALGIPTVALFGPFPSKLRVTGQSKTYAVDGHAECAPCFHHAKGGKDWPDGCIGWKSDRCAAMANIDPKRISDLVLKILKK